MKREINGLLVLDKPSGITSREALDQAARWFPRQTRIGHTGTLDPLATGVLVLCLGRATRLAEFVQGMDKTYRATFVFGARSDTDDADGTIVPVPGASAVDATRLGETLNNFVGAIEQTPPAYSAVKVAGKRAHHIARKGKPVEIAPRTVRIYEIKTIDYHWPELQLEIVCGKGTYIRSLARDLGEQLGVGAYVASLRRTRIGPFTEKEAVPLTSTVADVSGLVRPIADAVEHLPRIVLSEAEIDTISHGQATLTSQAHTLAAEQICGIFDAGENFVGIGIVQSDGRMQPVKNVGRG